MAKIIRFPKRKRRRSGKAAEGAPAEVVYIIDKLHERDLLTKCACEYCEAKSFMTKLEANVPNLYRSTLIKKLRALVGSRYWAARPLTVQIALTRVMLDHAATNNVPLDIAQHMLTIINGSHQEE